MHDAEIALLDNPIWNALRTGHAGLAVGDDRARRYPPQIGPLCGIPGESEESFEALRALAADDVIALFLEDGLDQPAPDIPSLTTIRHLGLNQMIRQTPQRLNDNSISIQEASSGLRSSADPSLSQLRPLNPADAPAMVALAELTEPGPFRMRTLELGGYYGIFHGGRLMAMAGRRLHLPGLVEVSAICTHPDARGRGYARILATTVIRQIEDEGATPFLHVLPTNPAIRLYEELGFSTRFRRSYAVYGKNRNLA